MGGGPGTAQLYLGHHPFLQARAAVQLEGGGHSFIQ